jgi:hypothetical protein
MYNNGIVICLKDSKNLKTINDRVNKLFQYYIIQYETRHPYNSTIGCFNAHIKALKNAFKILYNNSYYDYVIIAEEDIEINYKSKQYNNIIKSLNNYNKDSDYILHLSGFPSFTIDKFNDDNLTISSKIYLTTCYAVNIKIAHKLIRVLQNSSKHIHCDAIIAHSGIEQRLIKGNIINQLCESKSTNTYLHNFVSSRLITIIYLFLYNFRFIFFQNTLLQLITIIYSIYYYNLTIYLIELSLITINFIKNELIHKEYNKYLQKNIFTIIECIYLFRLFTIYEIYKMLKE